SGCSRPCWRSQRLRSCEWDGAPASIARRAKWNPTTTAYRSTRRSSTARRDGALMLDRLIHSFVVLDDPTALGYGYERAYAVLTQMQLSGRQQIHTLFLVGGRWSVSRQNVATLPQ